MAAIGFGPGVAVRQRGGGAAFDFVGALPPGAALTRASPAMRVDGGGVLGSVAADVARFDHDPVTLAPRGLLIEGAATNLALHSQDLTQGAWTRAGLMAQAQALIENTGVADHYAGQTIDFAGGATYCLSAVAGERAGSAKRFLVMRFVGASFAVNSIAKFDLATGQVVFGNAGVIEAGAVPMGGGQWLCWTTAAAASAASGSVRVQLSDAAGSGVTHTGDGTSGVALTHVQVEAGAAATSRIATGATAASRAADVLVLNWGSRGVPDGAAQVRYALDGGAQPVLAASVSGGAATVPVLAPPRLIRAAIA